MKYGISLPKMDSLWPTARTSREDCCTSCLSPGICWYLRSTITAEVGNCLTGRGRLTWLNFCLLFTGLAGLLMFSFQLPLHFWMAVISGAILCWYKSPLPFYLHTETAICWILFGTMLECWQRWSFCVLLWWILEACLFHSWNTTIRYFSHRNTNLIRHHLLRLCVQCIKVLSQLLRLHRCSPFCASVMNPGSLPVSFLKHYHWVPPP